MKKAKLERKFSRSFYCFIESFLYTSIVYFIFFYMSPFKYQFLEMNLHPLLIVVALISVRYGTHLSTFGVAFASIYYFLAYMNLERDPIIFFGSFEYYKFILMFFFTALFVGKLRDSTDEKIIHLDNELKSFNKGFKKQKKNNIKLSFINSRLKNQIVNSKESILTLHKVTSSLDKMEMEEIFTETLLNIKQFISCDVISIYSYNEEKNFARVKLNVGNGRMPTFFQLEDGSPHMNVVKTKEVQEFPLEVEGNTPIYISPILSGEKVIGFINVERLSFSTKERYSFEMFKIISHWLNQSLVKALETHEETLKENSYENTRILKMHYFNKRLEEERRRKKLFSMDFLAFEGNLGDISIKELNQMILGKIRDEDIIGTDGKSFKLIFPGTQASYKELVLSKLEKVFEGTDLYEI